MRHWACLRYFFTKECHPVLAPLTHGTASAHLPLTDGWRPSTVTDPCRTMRQRSARPSSTAAQHGRRYAANPRKEGRSECTRSAFRLKLHARGVKALLHAWRCHCLKQVCQADMAWCTWQKLSLLEYEPKEQGQAQDEGGCEWVGPFRESAS